MLFVYKTDASSEPQKVRKWHAKECGRPISEESVVALVVAGRIAPHC
jgi:hypothetical protein